MADDAGGEAASLRSVASRALGWSFANTVLSRFGTLAIGIALARLLGPEQFGVFAVATVALIAILSFNELGVSLAIVRWPGDPAVIAPTVTTIAFGSSLVLAAATYFAAPTYAELMGQASAAPVVQVMAVAIVINGLVATPAALLQRDFRQGRRMAIDQVNTWVGAIVSLVLVLMGGGAMSLAIGRVAGSALAAVMFIWWSPLRLRFGFDTTQSRGLFKFGLPLAGASLVVFLGGYADQLVAGSVLGATALGYYLLAFNLANWPGSIFSQPLRSVAPAAFARMQTDPAQMNQVFARLAGVLGAVALPVCGLLVGASAPLVAFVYGSVWLPSAAVLSLLGVVAGFRILFELAYDFLVVRGLTRAILVSQIAWLVAAIPALLIGARHWGLIGIATAQIVVAAAVMTPLYAFLLRSCGVSLRLCGRRLLVPVVCAAATGGLAWLISDLVASDFWACALAGTMCLLVVAGLVFHDRAFLKSIRRPAAMSPQDSTGSVST